jgi:nitrite reductase/ring-hydroxylating ferredoxin subunit
MACRRPPTQPPPVTRHVVCATHELPPGGRRIVEVDGRSIGVFNVAGDYLAIRNRCPHQGGPLCEGVQVGELTSDLPGDYEYSRPGEMIRCPWHGWEFDLRTGASWFDPARRRVRSYKVEVVPGGELEESPPRPGLRPGPYTAETVPVTVEGAYVVLELSGN